VDINFLINISVFNNMNYDNKADSQYCLVNGWVF